MHSLSTGRLYVSIAAKGVREITRHFASDKHWILDVTYRVHQSLQVYNKLLDPMELSESQTQEYLSRPFKEKPEGFSFPRFVAVLYARGLECAHDDDGELSDRDASEWWRLPLFAETVRPFPGNVGFRKPPLQFDVVSRRVFGKAFLCFSFPPFSLMAVITSCLVASGVCYVVFSGVEYCFVSVVTVPGFVPTSSAFAGSPHW